ncbi:GWxTD domain-containing protein [candidate division KSB1 bacterium]|nr:GWxTD domain-containing protein [candidate division KSB1 bacterium]
MRIIATLVLLAVTPIQAQMNAALDLAAFRYEQAQIYLEAYYAVPLSNLKFVATPSGALHAQALIRFSVFKDDSLWKDDAWKMEKTVAAMADVQSGQAMVDLVRHVLAPGKYRFVLQVEDVHAPGAAQTLQQELTLTPFSIDALGLSQIELAGAIKNIPADTNNRFYKNGMEVVPKPDAMFGKEAPLLYYYVEAYNLAQTFAGGVYYTQCQILDANQQPAPQVKPRVQAKKTLAASVEVGMLNVSTLPSGVFNLRFDLLDSNRTVRQSTSKRFYVYDPEHVPPAQPVVKLDLAQLRLEYNTMSEGELDEQFACAKYFADKEENKAYKSLNTPEAKRQFLAEFWRRRDPSPNTVTNEFKLEHQRRVAYANEHLQNYTRAGWKTDRGRVYIVFGPPSDVERFPNNPLSYAYEIWHYDQIEGGVIFVFVQLQGMGEYVQVHSTKRGEPQNKEWEEQIEK